MAGTLDRLATVVAGASDEELSRRIDEAALALAAHARADGVDDAVQAGLDLLDSLAVGVDPSLAGLEERLFDDFGLKGDNERYDAPENSYIDVVLARRRGLPITLAVIAMAVGRRVGVDLAPVALPGHFLVRHEGHPRVFLDCFSGGRRLTSGDCESIVQGLYGDTTAFDLDWLRPVGPRPVLVRMLANLAGSAARRGDRALALRVIEAHEVVVGSG